MRLPRRGDLGRSELHSDVLLELLMRQLDYEFFFFFG